MAKPLRPTLREKNRFVAFEVLSDPKFEKKAVSGTLWDSFLSLFGDLGGSEAGFWLIEWKKERSWGLLKVRHTAVDRVKAAMAAVGSVDGSDAAFHVIGVSGTVKSAREKYANG